MGAAIGRFYRDNESMVKPYYFIYEHSKYLPESLESLLLFINHVILNKRIPDKVGCYADVIPDIPEMNAYTMIGIKLAFSVERPVAASMWGAFPGRFADFNIDERSILEQVIYHSYMIISECRPDEIDTYDALMHHDCPFVEEIWLIMREFVRNSRFVGLDILLIDYNADLCEFDSTMCYELLRHTDKHISEELLPHFHNIEDGIVNFVNKCANLDDARRLSCITGFGAAELKLRETE